MEVLSGALHLGENVCGLRGPDKRRWVIIVAGEVFFQGGDQVRQTMEDSTSQALLAQLPEEAFHHVQPGSARRREVQMKAGVPRQPRFNLRVLVGRIVIQNQMHFALSRSVLVNQLQKLQPFLMPVSILALPENLPVGDVERRKERRRAHNRVSWCRLGPS